MNSSLKNLIRQLNENFNLEEDCDDEMELEEDPLSEDNSGNSGGEYMTPNAFSKKVKDPDDVSYSKKVETTDRFFKKIEETIQRLDEGNYNDYKNDDTKSERQKINGNIIEINRKLREVEQMISHASKLKTESGAGADIYWKATGRSFLKIKERLVRLSNKIVEISS
jgi:HD superfamily phosphohydrolase